MNEWMDGAKEYVIEKVKQRNSVENLGKRTRPSWTHPKMASFLLLLLLFFFYSSAVQIVNLYYFALLQVPTATSAA